MGTGKLIINLDVLFMNDLVMSLILLWATAKFTGLKIRIWSFLGSGLLGSVYTIIVIFPIFKGLTGFLYILLHLFLNLFTAVLMIWTAFGKLKLKKFIRSLGYFYLITFLAGGAALSIYFIIGSSPTNWIFGWVKLGDIYGWLYFTAVIMTLVLGRHGWKFIRERFYKERYHLKFVVWIEDQSVQVTGLLDTGNRLRDPFTRLPVIVVEQKVVLNLFPEEIQEILVEENLDVVDMIEDLLETSWFKRFLIIPFSSLGNQGDLLIGCKVDGLEILGDERRQVGRVILALHQGELDIEGDYQALLHPELLEAV